MAATVVTRWAFERKGTEWVTDDERRGRARALFWPWAGTSCNVVLLSFGPYPMALGLDWHMAVLAVIVGAILSFGLLAVVALLGQQGTRHQPTRSQTDCCCS